MLNIAVCVSGGGTNLQAILDGIEQGEITNTRVAAVISNNPGAYALERAENHGIEGVCISPKQFPDRESFNRAFLEKLDTLRDADAVYREELANADLDREIGQYFAVLTNTRSVGVMGDGRTYDYTLALRAVTTSDFMTADWARIPYDLLDRISTRIVNEVAGINRIVYDITSKPPATVEWE